ncbi:putative NRPS-like protein biosynthetic cluster [Purpureocillium takamizusanense]|uniref:NRPS-like protein biosynthetic cluster n=1 Tax=Purpureocillium takamizusanense TaxID=2060973 RepID=A0A9Q8VFG1_9HYPO|nr:putative NRPS-like protein biosynthetic cluster [Purpureocillium takamizusanense]UNI22879.1 putative NRPS-like protein biosynthetic cluster [Purpureocillium takamizusanense]
MATHDMEGDEQVADRRAEVYGNPIEDSNQSLWDVLSGSASQFPERTALISMWQLGDGCGSVDSDDSPEGSQCLRWTFADLHKRATDLADDLNALGCHAGMHMAAIFWNSAEWALFFWAAAKMGMVYVPIDSRGGEDTRFILSTLNPEVLVVQNAEMARSLDLGKGQTAAQKLLIDCSGSFKQGWMTFNGHNLRDSQGDRVGSPVVGQITFDDREGTDEAALIIFTSGTTGTPKGCIHTNRNLIAQTFDFDPDPPEYIAKWVVHTPVSHIFAINNALRAWRTGSSVVFPSKTFNVAATVRALAQEQCSVISATPTLVRALLAHKDFPSPDDLSLSMVTIGGTGISEEDIRLCLEELGADHAVQAYGMSEGAPLVSWARGDPMLTDGYHPGVGKILPGANVRICAPGTRDVLQRGEVGELHVGGPSVIVGYFAGADNGAFYADDTGKWLVTGDQGKIDEDGVVYLFGRYKDLIIRGGENIHPARIESALAELPGVQSQIVGIPDDTAGQLLVAVVNLPDNITKPQISEKAKDLGPKYTIDHVYTLQEIGLERWPVTSLGKPKKGLLTEAVVARFRSSVMASSSQRAQGPASQQLADVCSTLQAVWYALTGDKPGKDDTLAYLSDSIALLRYCDGALRETGRRLYLQDLAVHDTIEKQVKLLLDRESEHSDEDSSAQRNPTDYRRFLVERKEELCKDDLTMVKPHHYASMSPRELWDVGCRRLISIGLQRSNVEDIIPIRDSLQGMAAGSRPQSFHVRVNFRVAGVAQSKIRQALESGLREHPILRAVVATPPIGPMFHVVVEAGTELFARQIKEQTAVCEEQATQMCSDDATSSQAPEFMFSATIISIKNTNQCLLSMTYSHSVMDAMFLLQWHKDLASLVSGKPQTQSMRTPYILFADLHRDYQDSLAAQRDIRFHVQRLRGISRLQSALWPPQRAPGWMVSSDKDAPQAEARQKAREAIWKGEWNGQKEREFRFPHRSRLVSLPSLLVLRQACGIEAPILARCAVVLFSIMQTKSRFAVYSSYEGGRSWPFVPDWMQGCLPPPMSVDGPTVERVVNMVEVRPEETVREFFARMKLDFEQTVRHQHAPWGGILKELKEEAPTAVEATLRQSFVWDVSMGMALSPQYQEEKSSSILEPVSRHDWPDFGFCWNMFNITTDSILFIASWDTAQMSAREVDRCCDDMASVLRALGCEENWDKRVGACMP